VLSKKIDAILSLCIFLNMYVRLQKTNPMISLSTHQYFSLEGPLAEEIRDKKCRAQRTLPEGKYDPFSESYVWMAFNRIYIKCYTCIYFRNQK
jgi:hypothetical protein